MKLRYLFGFVAIALLSFFSCQEDDNFLSGDVNLAFSVDTLRFDTVFTTIGSATRSLKVYNRNDGIVKINSIRLDNGGDSFF